MKAPKTDLFAFAKFLGVGGANTIATLALYQGLLFVLPPIASYLVSYGTGVVISYFANSRFVFGAAGTRRKFAGFAVFQIVSATSGALFLAFLTRNGVSPRVGVLAVIVVLTPINFIGSKLILGTGDNNQE
ncbi:MAG: GtrA family protein [Pseudomonadota bacterium]